MKGILPTLMGLWVALVATLVAVPAAAAETEPVWPHQELTSSDGAVAWIDAGIATSTDATMRVRGNGWTNAAGDAPSTIAIKLNSSAKGAQFTRSGPDVVAHPSAAGDQTIWILLDADPGTHPNQRTIAADGSFDIAVDVPTTLATGDHLTVSITSGLFRAGDRTRSLQSKPIEVNGVAWDGGASEEGGTCVPTVAAPDVSVVSTDHRLGGSLVVRGAGWCAESGGSRIGVKIDEGAISRLDSTLHSNRTIWAVIDATAADGTFEARIQLPDGTTNTSAPALAEGVHTLRFLTGSLKPGDVLRSMTVDFQIGSYAPVFPEPVEATEALTSTSRNGVVVETRGRILVLTHPGAAPGDWVALTAFDGASPRLPWGTTWFRVRGDGTVRAPLKDADLPQGKVKLSLQSGNEGESGRLIGWTWVTFPTTAPQASPTDDPGNDPEPDPPTTSPTPTTSPATTVAGPAPIAAPVLAAAPAPEAPVASVTLLTTANAGDLIATQMGDRLRISLPGLSPSTTVHVFVYPASGDPVYGGTTVTAADRSIKVGLAGAAPGSHKVAIVRPKGALVGWVPIEVPSTPVAEAAPVAAPVRTSAVASSPTTDQIASADWWLIGGAAALILAAMPVALIRRRKGL